MTTIREYIEEKAAADSREWLRRSPRTTHPEILSLVRAFEAAGGGDNDSAERFVASAAGDLPGHRRHGDPDRHELIDQLGREVYIARGLLRDEANAAALAAALADGYTPVTEDLAAGRYLIRIGTLYSGYTVPVYGAPREVRAVRSASSRDGIEGVVFMPKGARTRGFAVSGSALVKRGWS